MGLARLSKSGTGQGTGQYEILTACPIPWDKMEQSRKGRSKTGKGCFKTKKDILKQERMF